jgi:seryl-tRNA synthetase
MIDIKKLASNKEHYLKKFTEKGYSLEAETTEVLNLFEKYNTSLKEEQEVRSELNAISKEIKNNPSDDIKAKAKDISTKAKEVTAVVSSLKEELEDKLLYFPNIARDDVKVGKDENDNVVLSTHNDDHKKEGKKPH